MIVCSDEIIANLSISAFSEGGGKCPHHCPHLGAPACTQKLKQSNLPYLLSIDRHTFIIQQQQQQNGADECLASSHHKSVQHHHHHHHLLTAACHHPVNILRRPPDDDVQQQKPLVAVQLPKRNFAGTLRTAALPRKFFVRRTPALRFTPVSGGTKAHYQPGYLVIPLSSLHSRRHPQPQAIHPGVASRPPA